ncbi:hypothetical protein Bca101_068471 [Brassica carinata]
MLFVRNRVHHKGETKESDEINVEESKGRTLGDDDRYLCLMAMERHLYNAQNTSQHRMN